MTKDKPKTHKKKKKAARHHADTIGTSLDLFRRSRLDGKGRAMFRLHADISQANKVLLMEVNENKGENLITYNKGKYTLKMCYE